MTETSIAPTIIHEDLYQRLTKLGWWVSVPHTTIPARWLYQGENRLDSTYYTTTASAALQAIKNCGFEVRALKEIAEFPQSPGRIKCIYAKNPADGIPLLTPSETLHFRPASTKFLASNTDIANIYKIQDGWILVTRAGTVGRCVIVGNRLARFAVTGGALRIQAQNVSVGYLYAYLLSWIGQALISKDQYGSSVKHLESHHLANIPVPLPPRDIQEKIHAEIMQAYALRDEANVLLDEADRLLHETLGLPTLDENPIPHLSAPGISCPPTNQLAMPCLQTYSIMASELADRLDASFYKPTARTTVKLLYDGRYRPVQLGSVVANVFIPRRFKRIYVSKQYGVPFLHGSHLFQLRPYDLKYISLKANAKHINECLLSTGYILVTRSGTVGRIGLVTSYMDKWAASQHLLRIVPDYNRGHPGFIAAFLMTPYGQHQLMPKIYGGVISHIEVSHVESVLIPEPPESIQVLIGEKVIQAFEQKDNAIIIEEAAIREVENLLRDKRTI